MAPRGRPTFKPTTLQRRQVEELLAVGTTVEMIARALVIDEGTLRKHFPNELANGAARRRLEVMTLLFKSARKGNVSSQKHLEQMTARASAEAAFTGAERPVRPARRGKKEEAADAALHAGKDSEWGDDLTPGAPVN